TLINDPLAFSRPAPAERVPTDLNELVAQIARLLEAEARRRDVAVAFHGEADLPRVVADEAQVKQVLMNLLLNALQACGSHGSVELTTRSEEERGERWCTVTVADSGAGIPPEHLEQIFDPFFTTKDAGSGLGLFIARQIVTAHGGHITTAPRPGGVPAGATLYLDAAALAPDGALALEALLDDARVWVLAGAEPGAVLPGALGARLSAVVLTVPPLAARTAELPALAAVVVEGLGRRLGIVPPRLAADAPARPS